MTGQFINLDVLNEEDLKILVKHIDLDILLTPMKKNLKTYEQYSKRLGAMKSSSPLVNMRLPEFVVELYKKNDVVYCELVKREVAAQLNDFINFMEDSKDSILPLEKTEGYVELYREYKKHNTTFDNQIYCIFLNISGTKLSPDEISRIDFSIKMQEKLLKQIDDKDDEITALKNSHKLEIEHINKSHSKESKRLVQQITSLESQIQKSIDELENIWQQDVAEKHEEQLSKLEEEYQNKLKELDTEYKTKCEKLKECFLSKEKDTQLAYEKLSNELQENFQKTKNEYDNLSEQKEELNCIVDELIAQKNKLEQYITSYFESFEAHAVARGIDKLLDNRLAQLSVFKNDSISSVNVASSKNTLALYGGEIIESSDRCEEAKTFDDVLLDFTDNLGKYFVNSQDIAFAILAAYYNNKALLIDHASAKKAADCLSAIVASEHATIIDICDGNYTLNDIVSQMQASESKVIIIDGLIERFDDKLIPGICLNHKEGIIIFSYSERETLKMISQKYCQYCIPLYLDEYNKLESSYGLIVGSHSLDLYRPTITEDMLCKCNATYFSKLKENSLLKNSTAVELTTYVSNYLTISKRRDLSSVIKNTICLLIKEDTEAEEYMKILEATM